MKFGNCLYNSISLRIILEMQKREYVAKQEGWATLLQPSPLWEEQSPYHEAATLFPDTNTDQINRNHPPPSHMLCLLPCGLLPAEIHCSVCNHYPTYSQSHGLFPWRTHNTRYHDSTNINSVPIRCPAR